MFRTSSRWRVPLIAFVLTASVAAWYYFTNRGIHDEFATLSGHQDGVYSMALSPDRKRIASGGGDGTVQLWNLPWRRIEATLQGHKGRVLGVAWSADGESVASCGADRSIRFWNAASGKELAAWDKLPHAVHEVALSNDGQMLAASVDANIYLWRMDNRKDPWILRGHKRPITGLAFLNETNELVSFASDKTVRIWDLKSKNQVCEMPGPVGHCFGLKLSADGKQMACVGGGRVHMYDLKQRQALEPIVTGGGIVCGAAFSPDGRTLAVGSQDKTVFIVDLATRDVRSHLNGHDFAVAEMDFLPDGKTLLTSSFDSTLKLWEVK